MRLTRFIASQAAATCFCGVAVSLTAIHPFIHHLESGTLDAILDYVYAASLDVMNRTNANEHR